VGHPREPCSARWRVWGERARAEVAGISSSAICVPWATVPLRTVTGRKRVLVTCYECQQLPRAAYASRQRVAAVAAGTLLHQRSQLLCVFAPRWVERPQSGVR